MMPAEQIEEIIVEKLRCLPEIHQAEVLRFIEYLEYRAVGNPPLPKQRMAQAARMLLFDYQHDDELTLFTVLDSELLPDAP